MNKETYFSELEAIKKEHKSLEEKKQSLKESYIEHCKPCNIGDIVLITLSSGRKEKGEVVSFGILKDGDVHITSYKQVGKNKYITSPNKSVLIL